jgi:hypothetical protein
MKKVCICLLSTLMAVLVMTGAANADPSQITLGLSSGNINFSGSGAGNVSISFSGTLTGSGLIEGVTGGVGTYTMSLTGTPTLSSAGGGNYNVNMNGGNIAFNFVSSSNSNDFFTGNMALTLIKDSTQRPELLATLTITASGGIFQAGWPVGSTSVPDLTVNLGSNPSLDALWAGTSSSTSGPISSGEVVPVPEPASIALLGSGLLMAGSWVKVRRRK